MRYLFSGDVDFTIPAHHVAIYMLVIVLCLLFTKYRAGLIMTFLFSFYWVFIINKDKIRMFTGGENSLYMALYFICGTLVAGLSLWSFYMEG